MALLWKSACNTKWSYWICLLIKKVFSSLLDSILDICTLRGLWKLLGHIIFQKGKNCTLGQILSFVQSREELMVAGSAVIKSRSLNINLVWKKNRRIRIFTVTGWCQLYAWRAKHTAAIIKLTRNPDCDRPHWSNFVGQGPNSN